MSDKPPDQIERLQSEVAALRELMNVYNLGGWTDSERLMRERNEARAELAALRADGVDARRWRQSQAALRARRFKVDRLIAGDWTHTSYSDFLTDIDAEIAEEKANG